MQTIFKKRLRRVINELKRSDESAALLIGSAPLSPKSRDTNYDFYQDRDFYYVTGIDLADVLLFISAKSSKATLIASPEDAVTRLWDGPRPNLKNIAKRLGADLILTENSYAEVRAKLAGHSVLYFTNQPGNKAWKLAQSFIEQPSHSRRSLPSIFKHCDDLLAPLRLIKDQHEIKLIKQAAEISWKALIETRALISSGTRECDLAAALVYMFKLMDAEEAFGTIAASGKSAATLHHRSSQKLIKKGELLLLDFGASYHNYASDITRVFPVKGYFEGWQSELYQAVLSAQTAALKKVRAGVLVKQIYDAAARELTIGLKELGVLRGSTTKLLARQAYRPYFPHGIGHTLGLDVHDVGDFRGNNKAHLRADMVFTIEPGLYFSNPCGRVPACGVRIEDDIQVTRDGYRCLTSQIPKEMLEIEKFLAA